MLKIKENFESLEEFIFGSVTTVKVRKEILNLDDSKATQYRDTRSKILKESVDICLTAFINISNSSFRNGCFPEELKMTEVFPIFKKKDSLDKENYRPVSILSHMSKFVERLMYKQFDNYVTDKLSPLLTGFKKNHNTGHSISTMLEKFRNKLSKGKFLYLIFSDLSKAFHSIDHN